MKQSCAAQLRAVQRFFHTDQSCMIEADTNFTPLQQSLTLYTIDDTINSI